MKTSTKAELVQAQLTNKVFERRHGVTEDQLSKLKDTFPSWEFIFGNEALHPHPLGATERAITEQYVIEEITRKFGRDMLIVDIGGNANRHARSGRTNIHSCNPIISAADAVRRSPDSYVADAVYCNRRTRDCPIIPDVYIAIHSLYYLSQHEVLRCVLEARKHRLYATVHDFSRLYGSFHVNKGKAESTYEAFYDHQDELKVHMKVHGNHTGYTHSACSWLYRTNYFTDGQFAMAWTSIPIGDTFVFEFVEAPLGLTAENLQPMPLCESLNRNDHYGPVDGMVCHGDRAELSPTLETLKIDRGTTVSYGSFTVTTVSRTQHVLVPKDLIVYVSNDLIGLERNDKTLIRCINTMRVCLKTYKVPESMKTNCLTYGAAFAFVLNLNDEITAFNSLCRSPLSRLYARLKSSLSLSPLGCCEATADVSVAKHREENASMLAKMYANDFKTPAIVGSFDARKAWPKGLPGYESEMSLAEMKSGARIHDKGLDDLKVYNPQLQVNCPIFTPIDRKSVV